MAAASDGAPCICAHSRRRPRSGGAVVWAGEGRSAATVQSFFSQLGPERVAVLEAISCDMSAGYLKAIGTTPDAPMRRRAG